MRKSCWSNIINAKHWTSSFSKQKSSDWKSTRTIFQRTNEQRCWNTNITSITHFIDHWSCKFRSMKEKKTLHYCLKNLHYCLKNLESLMQFTFEFVCFSVLFLKTSLAFLINLNRHLLRINIRFIHHISHHSRFVVDVASQYDYVCSKLRNEIKFD